MKSTIRCCRGVMSDTVASLLSVRRTLPPGIRGRKHMFGSGLDTEHTFGRGSVVGRARGRRRRVVGGALLVGALSLSAPAVGTAVAGRAPRGTDAADRYVARGGAALWASARGRPRGSG